MQSQIDMFQAELDEVREAAYRMAVEEEVAYLMGRVDRLYKESGLTPHGTISFLEKSKD